MKHWTARLVWTTWALTSVCVALALWLMVLNAPSEIWVSAFNMLVLLSCATVGALVAWHRPSNPIGWIFCAGACLWALGDLAVESALYTLVVRPGALPGGLWLAWVGIWARGFGALLLMTFLLLLFPTGRLVSPRWRPIGWFTAANLLCFTVAATVIPPSFDIRLPYVRNAIGIALDTDVLEWIQVGTFTLFVTNVIACAIAVAVRFRRARGDERQQIKWLVYAAALAIVLLNLTFLLTIVFELAALPSAAYYLGLAGIPIGVGIAILRHHLYDIDILINRTLVYGTLTISLALVYVGSVVLLRAVLAQLTGSSELAIMASTLAIAALFNPLRKRIQNTIDRRFYRRKYNAAKVLTTFGITARDETDLDVLTSELLRVIDTTVQPELVALWLRDPATTASGDATKP